VVGAVVAGTVVGVPPPPQATPLIRHPVGLPGPEPSMPKAVDAPAAIVPL
jgi:hypothetical protein